MGPKQPRSPCHGDTSVTSRLLPASQTTWLTSRTSRASSEKRTNGDEGVNAKKRRNGKTTSTNYTNLDLVVSCPIGSGTSETTFFRVSGVYYNLPYTQIKPQGSESPKDHLSIPKEREEGRGKPVIGCTWRVPDKPRLSHTLSHSMLHSNLQSSILRKRKWSFGVTV